MFRVDASGVFRSMWEACLDSNSIVELEGGLHKDLTKGQVIMISLGEDIGTSLFLSSGIALDYAGPSVLVSYAIAGFIAVVMMFSLSEMAVVHPTAGSVGTYAETYLNPWAGFVVRSCHGEFAGSVFRASSPQLVVTATRA